jgi:hypothetical protein
MVGVPYPYTRGPLHLARREFVRDRHRIREPEFQAFEAMRTVRPLRARRESGRRRGVGVRHTHPFCLVGFVFAAGFALPRPRRPRRGRLRAAGAPGA